MKFLESTGMRFGPSLNAGTSFDETVYMLQIPTDKPEIVAKAFLVLEDWAHNLSFEPAEIDKERGVIIEEWRLGRGAAARMQDKQIPILLKGSRYAERNCRSARRRVIETFKHDRLKRFYRDWYRPDLMAVDRRRRFRQGGGREAAPAALRVDPGGDEAAAAARRTRCRPTRTRSTRLRPTRRRPATSGRRLQQAAAARHVDGRRVPPGASSKACSAAMLEPPARRT